MIQHEPALDAYIRRLRRWEPRLLAAVREREFPRPDPLCTTTLGQYGGALLAADLRALGLKERSRQRYFLSLFGVVETGQRHEEGCEPRDHRAAHYGDKWHRSQTPGDFPTVIPVLLTDLAPKTVDDFQQAMAAALGEKSGLTPSAKNTIASQIAHAKAAFTPSISDYLAREFHLVIPRSILNFRNAECYKLDDGDDEPPHEKYVLVGHIAVRKLWQENRVLFVIVFLALFCGLTRSEIIAARHSWVVDTSTGPILRVWAGSDNERDVPIAPWSALALRQQGDYLVSGETEADRAKHCNEAVDYLRMHGFGDVFLPLKRLEECCAWYFASCKANYSEALIREILGYSPDTVQKYTKRLLTQNRCAFWEAFPLSMSTLQPFLP